MLIESRELHKRYLEQIQKLYGQELTGLLLAQQILNEYEGELMEAEVKDYEERNDNGRE